MSDQRLGLTKLERVRVHHVNAHEPRAMKTKAGEKPAEPKYSITVLMHVVHDAEKILQCRRGQTEVAKDKWGDKLPFFPANMKALKDAKEFKGDKPAYADCFYISASNKNPVPVVNRNRQPLKKETGLPYNGCYCNVVVRFWAQDDKDYGKRINCSLEAIQFVEDGEKLGGGGVDPDEVFDDLGGDSGSATSSAGDDDLL